MNRYKENNIICKGCRWLHIGQNVDHNHCMFPYDRGTFGISSWDSFEERANGYNDTYCPRRNREVK